MQSCSGAECWLLKVMMILVPMGIGIRAKIIEKIYQWVRLTSQSVTSWEWFLKGLPNVSQCSVTGLGLFKTYLPKCYIVTSLEWNRNWNWTGLYTTEQRTNIKLILWSVLYSDRLVGNNQYCRNVRLELCLPVTVDNNCSKLSTWRIYSSQTLFAKKKTIVLRERL